MTGGPILSKLTSLYCLVLILSGAGATAQLVETPKDIDHQPWHDLVQRYVNEQGMVDYKSWKQSETDLKNYVTTSSNSPPPGKASQGVASV
ncbi:MAG: hypothetical protein ACLFS1_06100 [Opitutales bacterium]